MSVRVFRANVTYEKENEQCGTNTMFFSQREAEQFTKTVVAMVGGTEVPKISIIAEEVFIDEHDACMSIYG